jgi:hypothetical protein
VVNKVHSDYIKADGRRDRPSGEVKDALLDGLKASFNGTPKAAELAQKVAENFERYRMLAERDRENMALLTERLDEDCVLEVPYLDEDVHDIGGLAHINRYLFASGAERRQMLEQMAV